MFGIGMPELIIILVIALIIIGPKKLPDLAKALGKGMSEFKKATEEIKGSLNIDEELKEAKADLIDSVSGLDKAPVSEGPDSAKEETPKYEDFDDMLDAYDAMKETKEEEEFPRKEETREPKHDASGEKGRHDG